MEHSLRFLYQRIKKPNLTKEQAESKVCQEVFIMKVGSSKLMNTRIAFKGGLIIDSLAHGKRGYTKDIDFDLIKYPLSEIGLKAFIDDLNKTKVFTNISIEIESIEDLRHRHYQGKRISLVFSDNKDKFNLLIDIGVYLPIIKKNNPYRYEVAFGEVSPILIYPVERILAEKLSTFAIYGTDNTRAKDLFDAFWIMTHFKINKKEVLEIMKIILVRRLGYFKNESQYKNEIMSTLRNDSFKKKISTSKRNWTGINLDKITKEVIKFIAVE